MIKISHEAPLSIFDMVQGKTDYDYCLCHLYDENSTYRDKFLEAKKKGREIILDTSVFELGHAFDEDKYIEIIKELQPEWYIVPDVLENSMQTYINAVRWKEEIIDKLPGKPIVVAQGRNLEDFTNCFKALASLDMPKIAISFDYSFYSDLYKHPNVHVSRMLGRPTLLRHLVKEELLNSDMKLHLLGCALPQEGLLYSQNSQEGFDFIDSMDTSNPCVHGIKKVRYTDQGLWDKESVKLFTLINEDLDRDSIEIVKNNIMRFRWFWNQSYDFTNVEIV